MQESTWGKVCVGTGCIVFGLGLTLVARGDPVYYAFSGTTYERDPLLGTAFDQYVDQPTSGLYWIEPSEDGLYVSAGAVSAFTMGSYSASAGPTGGVLVNIYDRDSWRDDYCLDYLNFSGESVDGWLPGWLEVALIDFDANALPNEQVVQDFLNLHEFEYRWVNIVFSKQTSPGVISYRRVRATLDELYIVPEPTALLFVALGAAALARRRRFS